MASGITSRVLLIALLCGICFSFSVAQDPDAGVVLFDLAHVCDISGASVSTKIESLAGPAVFLTINNGIEILFWTVFDAKLLIELVLKDPEDQTRLENVTIIREFLADRYHASADASAQSAMIELFKKFSFKTHNLCEMGPRWSIAVPRVLQEVTNEREELVTTFVDLSVIDKQTGDVLTSPACMPAQRNQILNDRCAGKSPFAFLYVLPDVGITKKNLVGRTALPLKSPDFSETRFFTARKICGALATVCALGWTMLTGDTKDPDLTLDPDDTVVPELPKLFSRRPLRPISQRRCATPPARCHQTKEFDVVCEPRAASVPLDAQAKRGEVAPRGSFQLYKNEAQAPVLTSSLPVATPSPLHSVRDVATSPFCFDEHVERSDDALSEKLQDPEKFVEEDAGVLDAQSAQHDVYEIGAMTGFRACSAGPESAGYRRGQEFVFDRCHLSEGYLTRSFHEDAQRAKALAHSLLIKKIRRLLRPAKYAQVEPKKPKKPPWNTSMECSRGFVSTYAHSLRVYLCSLKDEGVHESSCSLINNNITHYRLSSCAKSFSRCLSRDVKKHASICVDGCVHVFVDDGKLFFFTLKQVVSAFNCASDADKQQLKEKLFTGKSLKELFEIIHAYPVEITFCFNCKAEPVDVFLRICRECFSDYFCK